jgi:hypothetical protein
MFGWLSCDWVQCCCYCCCEISDYESPDEARKYNKFGTDAVPNQEIIGRNSANRATIESATDLQEACTVSTCSERSE